MPEDGGTREVIDPRIATPVWRQVADILRRRIRDGRYPAGLVIPSEKQMEHEFGVARLTARKAVAQLRDEGLVVTVMGRGTFVADPLPPEDEASARA